MSEGTTAIQVSPFNFNVEDAMTVRKVFEAAANAVVDASNLKQEVAGLREELNMLRRTLDSLMTERDEARKAKDQAEFNLLLETEKNADLNKAMEVLAEKVKDRDVTIDRQHGEAGEARREIWALKDRVDELEKLASVKEEQLAHLTADSAKMRGIITAVNHALNPPTVIVSNLVPDREADRVFGF